MSEGARAEGRGGGACMDACCGHSRWGVFGGGGNKPRGAHAVAWTLPHDCVLCTLHANPAAAAARPHCRCREFTINIMSEWFVEVG